MKARPISPTLAAIKAREAQLLARLTQGEGDVTTGVKEYAIAVFTEPAKPGQEPPVFRTGLSKAGLLSVFQDYIDLADLTMETPQIVISGRVRPEGGTAPFPAG